MAFHLDDGEAQSLTEINLVPLIDIMLVLMIAAMVLAFRQIQLLCRCPLMRLASISGMISR